MTVRTLLFSALALFLFAPTVRSQPADSLVVRGKRLLDTGYDHGDLSALRQARALFQQAVDASGDRAPLGRYYDGLAGYRLLPFLEDEDRQLQVMDASIAALERAVEAAPEAADAHALLAALYGWKASKQWYKAMVLGPKADRAMERARALASDNPRVVLLHAIGLYNKPGLFGGDKKKALEGFERAARLAAGETPADPFQPDWGEAEAYAWAGVAHLEADRPGEAREAFQAALRVNPDFGWVKDVLLPQIAEAR